jgi:transcriptional regulator with GAF, ATPase, and Fis domain
LAKDPLATALTALAQFQITRFTVGETLQQIAEVTVEAIPAAEVVGMTMLDDDEKPSTAIYTDEDSPDIDAAQYREGRGPCLDAWRQMRVVRLDDIADRSSEYPGFVEACQRHNVRSTLSLPMVAGDVGIGAMNLYARAPGSFQDSDETVGLDLASAAAVVLENVSAYWTAFDLGTNLGEAMKTRAVIEQAKGMLMARSPGLTPDGAFQMLRSASQRENVKLRDVARRLVDGRPPPEPEEDATR